MPELSIYHQKNLQKARERVTELAGLKTPEMGPRELLVWLTRMECTAVDLLNVVDLLLAVDAREVRDDR